MNLTPILIGNTPMMEQLEISDWTQVYKIDSIRRAKAQKYTPIVPSSQYTKLNATKSPIKAQKQCLVSIIIKGHTFNQRIMKQQTHSINISTQLALRTKANLSNIRNMSAEKNSGNEKNES